MVRLTAVLLEAKPLRYTPAGVPAIELTLQHESRQILADAELEKGRIVQLTLSAVAFGPLALRLSRAVLGNPLEMRGFLANAKRGKQTLFHIQECDLV